MCPRRPTRLAKRLMGACLLAAGVFFGVGLAPGDAFAQRGGDKGGDLIGVDSLDPVTRGAFLRKYEKLEQMRARGLLESGLVPVYPENARCPEIDHIFGEPWRGPVANQFHSGADIPAAWNEPIHAVASGVVVAKFKGEVGFRGLQVVIRHAPEDTGLPVWLYTLYSHFNEMPAVEIGQRLRMGDYLGPNGKTGVPGKRREPHLHLTVNFSQSPRYVLLQEFLIPESGYFIDPVALFRGRMPIDTHAMRALPEAERRVKIAYKLKTGAIVPPDAKIIWPFLCTSG